MFNFTTGTCLHTNFGYIYTKVIGNALSQSVNLETACYLSNPLSQLLPKFLKCSAHQHDKNSKIAQNTYLFSWLNLMGSKEKFAISQHYGHAKCRN